MPDPEIKKDETPVVDEAAITEKVTTAVTEALGLKSGQSLADVINAVASEATRSTLGLKEGQDAKEYFSTIIKDASPATKPDPDHKVEPKPDSKADTGLRAEFAEMKQQMKTMSTERDEAVETAHESKRSNAITALVDDFNVKPEMKQMLIKSLVHGLEGPPIELNDAGSLSVKDGENGAPREAKAYMEDYFKDNAWMLASKKRTGSRTPKGDPKSDAVPELAKDDKGNLATGLALVQSYAKLAENDADGALEALRLSNREKSEAMGMPL